MKLISDCWNADPERRFSFLGIKLGDTIPYAIQVLRSEGIRCDGHQDIFEEFKISDDSVAFTMRIIRDGDKVSGFVFESRNNHTDAGFGSLTLARCSKFFRSYPCYIETFQKEEMKDRRAVIRVSLIGDDHVVKIEKYLDFADNIYYQRRVQFFTIVVISRKEYDLDENRISSKVKRFFNNLPNSFKL